VSGEAVGSTPVLFVAGIWDTAAQLAPLRRGLGRRAVGPVHAFDCAPNDGRVPIPELGRQLGQQADEIARREQVPKVDVVGFSMGALVARW
jgi:triacylglycerol esterase/lipase EstA (alpha/beta hydrolase family)